MKLYLQEKINRTYNRSLCIPYVRVNKFQYVFEFGHIPIEGFFFFLENKMEPQLIFYVIQSLLKFPTKFYLFVDFVLIPLLLFKGSSFFLFLAVFMRKDKKTMRWYITMLKSNNFNNESTGDLGHVNFFVHLGCFIIFDILGVYLFMLLF